MSAAKTNAERHIAEFLGQPTVAEFLEITGVAEFLGIMVFTYKTLLDFPSDRGTFIHRQCSAAGNPQESTCSR